MRLWTLHPRYLDSRGLVACWREALLARQVLAGRTSGYRFHPQLWRFRQTADPLAAIHAYLQGLWEEAQARAYRFDAARIGRPLALPASIPVTTGQMAFEKSHLMDKLAKRAPAWAKMHDISGIWQTHPLFYLRDGDIEPWERSAKSKG